MQREEARAQIERVGIIPAIRVSTPEDALFTAEAVASQGIPIAEITMTVPGALEVIAQLARRHPSFVVGAGTVVDVETARRCVEAGASFLTSPGIDVAVAQFAVTHNVVVFPGALTPTEIMAAWKTAPDFVKVFPCEAVGGPAYVKALHGPFPEIPFIASGGVNQQTAADFILAGAVALGIGRELVPPEAIHRRQQHWIAELARRFLSMVKEARDQVAPQPKTAART
ncbi:MAG: bifunctional 4-hydroxy-2-oxoglutarate aldolase/2-dehydro-3-deoxy-phosphogluconate aldolase [Acidobacteriia bacterium]|nr:bifunctional 4-hydroxy-2-oxoglutarate aldolase/2-dehydro-3-deoxy-phosphogluconate aldolase [Terriglobia bacterium]